MSYNLAGMMTSSTLPNGKSISTDYDRMGRITAVTSDWVDADHPAVLANNFAYHATGALTGIDYGNGTTSTRSYTSGGLLKTLQHGDGVDPGALLDLEYHYDEGLANNGRIMEITDHDDASRTQSHAYDGFYRLATAETQGPHWGLSFSYDRYGNRLSQSATKGSPPTHSAT
ncbi:MAG TPA: hypothetical protein VLU25_21410, partial [Acidobacteriota bacterium]|nr:hypothetical protein [Acidobacteriota bacterium]